MARRKSRWPRLSRDAVLFLAGLVGIAHETVIADADRPTLLFLFATMVGLPAFLRNDELHFGKDDEAKEEKDEGPPRARTRRRP